MLLESSVETLIKSLVWYCDWFGPLLSLSRVLVLLNAGIPQHASIKTWTCTFGLFIYFSRQFSITGLQHSTLIVMDSKMETEKEKKKEKLPLFGRVCVAHKVRLWNPSEWETAASGWNSTYSCAWTVRVIQREEKLPRPRQAALALSLAT